MFDTDRLNLAIVTGSVRDGRFGPTVSAWFADRAEAHGAFTVDLIDLAELSFPEDMTPSTDVDSFAARIDAADAVVIVTPEYNHSYPGPLKTAIDALKQPWHAKPVGFVAYGGMSGGLRAVEPLRVVFSELHAITIRDTVSFHRARTQFDESGQPINAAEVNAAAEVVLDQLEWWALALREARAKRPYGQKVAV
jgi:NAD(P)H-dependent FMN reductase